MITLLLSLSLIPIGICFFQNSPTCCPIHGIFYVYTRENGKNWKDSQLQSSFATKSLFFVPKKTLAETGRKAAWPLKNKREINLTNLAKMSFRMVCRMGKNALSPHSAVNTGQTKQSADYLREKSQCHLGAIPPPSLSPGGYFWSGGHLTCLAVFCPFWAAYVA